MKEGLIWALEFVTSLSNYTMSSHKRRFSSYHADLRLKGFKHFIDGFNQYYKSVP